VTAVKRILLAAVFFALLIAIWQGVVVARLWSPVLLPGPRDVGLYLWSALLDGSLIAASVVTLRRLAVGYVIGVVIGLPLGLLSLSMPVVEGTLGVLALGLQTLPSVCWVPLALLWFGQTEGALLFVVVMGTVWSVMIATDTGARTIPPLYARAARTMGSRGLHTWTRVILPAALPHLITGMKQGWAFAWRSLMSAEIFVSILTGFGLGNLLEYGRDLNAMDQVIGVIIVIVVIGLIVDKALFGPCEQMLHRRWGTGK
jgi:NitT/TauT family transport system permease protein